MPLPFDFNIPPKNPTCQRILEDRWNSNPPQVTSFLSFPRSKVPSIDFKVTYDSPKCGFGWYFQLTESFRSQQAGNPVSDLQGLTGQLDISFKPPLLFSSLPISNVVILVKVTYPRNSSPFTQEKTFNNVSLKAHSDLGSYEEPAQYTGSAIIAITISFSPLDGLSLPTSPSVDFKTALCQSFDDPVFIDTKFYLYSAKKRSIPIRPKEVFAKSTLLVESSSYLQSLLSSGTGFKSGTPCDLQREVPEELAKLAADVYEYDSDSDLESLIDEEEDMPQSIQESFSDVSADEADREEEMKQVPDSDGPCGKGAMSSGTFRGRAFAINGTAYQTWKAFMFYTYTNNIHFNPLKSQNQNNQDDAYLDSTVVACSPKSMYRFADYADLPVLRALAKEGIRKGLCKSNIVAELFSTFTYKYQEIIEMEVDFLLKEFTPQMGRELDDMLQFVVVGAKPHCYRVLAFIMRRQRGESSQNAWRVLDGGDVEPPPQAVPRPRSPTPRNTKTRPPTPRSHPSNSTQSTVPPPLAPQQNANPTPTSPRPFIFPQPVPAPPVHQPLPRSSFFFTPTTTRRSNSSSTGGAFSSFPT